MKAFITHALGGEDESFAATLKDDLRTSGTKGYMAEKAQRYDLVIRNKIRREIKESEWLVAILPHRREIESEIRPDSRSASHEGFGTAVVGGQRPLIKANLKKAPRGVSVMQDYRLFHGRTFFWAPKEHLEKPLNARMYRNRPHDVLAVDTKTLIRDHLDRITFSPINSGAAISQNGEHGQQTFKSIADYPFDAHEKKRPAEPLVELAVEYEVGDMRKHVVRVERRHGSKKPKLVWERRGRPA